jgi:hypothetical protein
LTTGASWHRLTQEAPATAPRPRLRATARSGAGERLGTRRPASCDPPTCCEIATCVRDPVRCEPPRGRRSCNSRPGCEGSSPAVHGSPAGRTKESKKNFCCVTTRRHNVGTLRRLARQLGPLTARALSLSVLCFGLGGRSTFGLPPRRLPAADLPQTLRILSVALVPAPRLVLAAAPFAQADPRARSSRSGQTAVCCFNLAGAHGRSVSQGKARGECASVLLGRLSIREPER